MKKRFKAVISILLVLVMLFGVAACGANNTTPAGNTNNAGNQNDTGNTTPPANEPVKGGIFTTYQTTAAATLMLTHKSGAPQFILPAVEPLVYLNLLTYELEPVLAESYEETKADNSVTFHLRKGVKFHDGSDLTAEVVKWNIEFMMENGLGASIGNPSEVKVIDQYTVKVLFPTYNMTAARLLANVYIYSKKTFDEKGLDYCDVHPVGTGPFVFKEYVPDGYVTFVKNDNYWQAGKPYLDGVEIKIIADANAAMTAFANKQLDTLSTSDEAIKQQIAGMGYKDIAVVTFDNQSITSFAPNTFVEGDPWSNIKVRQAVMLYGIDPVEVGMLAAGPVAQPNSQFCMPGSLMYSEEVEKTITYDLDKAKALLAEAGYPNGFKTDAYPTNVNVAVATALQDVFKRLGIEMEIHTIPNGDTRRGDGVTAGIFFCNGKSKYDQLSGLITTVFHTDASQMSRNIKFSAEYEALYNKAMAAETEAERAKLAKELAYKLHVEECLSRVIYTKMGSVYIQDNVHDEQLTYTNPDYVNIWKSK